MIKKSMKNLVLAGLVGLVTCSTTFAIPNMYNSGTQLYDVSGTAGACTHNYSGAVDSCDQSSGNQAEYSRGTEAIFPTQIQAFECVVGSLVLPQIGHAWTGFFAAAFTQLFKNYYLGGTVGPHPILEAVLWALAESGHLNGGVPETYAAVLAKFMAGDSNTMLDIAKAARSGLQTAMAAAFPANGSPGTCIFEHPGKWFEYMYNHPALAAQPWWGPTAKVVADQLFDLSKPNAGCHPTSTLSSHAKSFIGCAGY